MNKIVNGIQIEMTADEIAQLEADKTNFSIPTSELRKQALAELDPLICQINRYKLLNQDASVAEMKLINAMVEINNLYPQED